MKNLYSKKSIRSPITKTLVAGLTMAVLIAPVATTYAAHKPNHAPKGNAYGHLVAPGFIKNFGAPTGTVNWLPPGIAKKLGGVTGDPKIELIDVSSIATSAATVLIEANENVSVVLYVDTVSGFATDDADITKESMHMHTDHTFELTGLLPDTTYFYRVLVTDLSGNDTLSSERSFTTDELDTTDSVAPVITNVATTDTHNTITASWTTNEAADSVLYLSTTTPVNIAAAGTITKSTSALTSNHSLTATGLVPSTTYYGFITTTDASGNTATSSTFTVTTDEAPDVTGPVLTNILTDASTTKATVTWNTNEPSTGVVYYSTLAGFDLEATTTTKVIAASLVTNHSIELTGLTADQTYYFVVASVDASDNDTVSTIASFTTDAIPDTTGPVISNITGLAGTTTLTGMWTTNEAATSIIYTATSSGFALADAGVTLTQNPALTLNHSLTITGLTASTTYFHRIKSVDGSGNETVSSEFTFGTI